MRPSVRFLSDALVERILDEARIVLSTIGVEICSDDVLSMLSDHGAHVDTSTRRARLTGGIIDRALDTVPESFSLYDVLGRRTHEFSGDAVHFTPGSSAINVLDRGAGGIRPPTTDDYVRYAKVVSGLDHIASQSTALIPRDVPEQISDSYRLYLSLLLCEKPVITGTFSAAGFAVMRDLQLAVRGTQKKLAQEPLTVFSCCATTPLTWSEGTSRNIVDCAKHSIPIELISMPLSGFTSPVSLVGSLVLHTAEVLSGIVVAQLAAGGAPLLYGGSSAIFDVRFETTPMGAIESMMMACAHSEIGRHLGIPTQAYAVLSDSKHLDAQCGLESSMGATLAVLAGINNISGPGMLDFQTCLSLDKLVVDNEICGMTLRMAEGVVPREDFPTVPRFEELLAEKHLLISEHTRRYLRQEHRFPGPTMDRAGRSRWEEEGALTLRVRAHREVDDLLAAYEPSRVSDTVRADLRERMETEARLHGMQALPRID